MLFLHDNVTFKSDNGPPFSGNDLPNKTAYQTRDIDTRLPTRQLGSRSIHEAQGKAIKTARAENRN